MEKHKPKKRNIILLAVTAAWVIAFLIYAIIAGQTYTIIEVLGFDPIDMSTVTAEISDESVVRLTDSRVEKRQDDMYIMQFELESVGMGSCTFDLKYVFPGNDPDEIWDYKTDLTVLPFGMIYNSTNNSFTALRAGIPFLLVLIFIVLTMFIISFIEKLLKGYFSYSMVALGGVILFLLLSFINILLDYEYWTAWGSMMTISDILLQLIGCGQRFISVINIPMILLAVSLAVSNIWLIIREGIKVYNALGIMIGVLLVGGMYIIDLSNNYLASGNQLMYYVGMVVNLTVTFLSCYVECMFISTMFCAAASTRYKPAQNMDYIIILGCAIRGDGAPTPLLRGRVQRAFDFESAQFAGTGRHAKFVPSGGQGSDEVISEAESMKRCLMEMGVPEERIVKEDKSVNTYQNMAFSKKIIEEDAKTDNPNIGFSTTNYHVFRGYTLAQKAGIRAKGLSAKTKLYFFPNAFVREFIGLLWEEKLRHAVFSALIVLTMVTFYIMIMI